MTDKNWINNKEYPFTPNFFKLPEGRMHYVDEGEGDPVVMVHGTPVWSFVYRNLIKDLSANYRAIAPDHLGFGLSDKPENWSARPADHARNLDELIKNLNLKNITLVVHDFGGPIGLSYALENPQNVARLVIFNSWMWSLADDKNIARGSRLFGGALGKLLYKGLNLSPKMLIPQVTGDKSKLTKEIHQHYINAFPKWGDRHAPWAMARELLASSDWFDGLWQKRERIKNIPALILWGMKDPTLNPAYLERWRELFADSEIIEFPNAGHFLQEEEPTKISAAVRRFLSRTYQELPDKELEARVS